MYMDMFWALVLYNLLTSLLRLCKVAEGLYMLPCCMLLLKYHLLIDLILIRKMKNPRFSSLWAVSIINITKMLFDFFSTATGLLLIIKIGTQKYFTKYVTDFHVFSDQAFTSLLTSTFAKSLFLLCLL